MAILPVPSSRVSDYLVRQRLVQQVQSDQLALLRLQTQLSTGQRLFLPSDDAPAALRVINLQRTLERKGQMQSNLSSSQSLLTSAESSLASVSTLLSEIRAAALGAADTSATSEQRQAVAQQVSQALQQLVDTGNAKFQGRYLFSGSRSLDAPYVYNGQYVEYQGNESTLRSYVDLDVLYETNIPGAQVLGGLSHGAQGSVDLDPHLTSSTLVGQLNGGAGIGSRGAVSMRFVPSAPGEATITSTVDLSSAATVGDVARLLEEHAPAGTELVVEITGDRLRLSTAEGGLVVTEVGAGQTAHELGIYTGADAPPAAVITGDDLNPTLVKTTPLANLLGSKAQGRLELSGANNDLRITAAANGASYNNLTIAIVGGGTLGGEVAAYDNVTNTLTVTIQAGSSTASHVAAAINTEEIFHATNDPRDATSTLQSGSGPVAVGTYANVTDTSGSGSSLDIASGLVIANGGDPFTVDTSTTTTVEDLLNLLNRQESGLLAEINSAGNGINVRSRRSGAELSIGENGGTTATQLGIRTFTDMTRLDEFNDGVGVTTEEGFDIEIVARDGTVLEIDLSTATTVGEVINLINSDDQNGGKVLARLAAVGSGFELVDSSGGSADLIIRKVGESRAIEWLGFTSDGASQASSSTGTLQSEDRRPIEVEGVFHTLIELRDALLADDVLAIGRATSRLDDDLTRANFARSDLGARLQSLDSLQVRLEDEEVELRRVLSQDLDVDLVEAISNFTARQYALQASLQTTAQVLQLSLLNYL
ncbi:MAG: flagellar hook-associated protein FlgL [Pirellulales bacterium]